MKDTFLDFPDSLHQPKDRLSWAILRYICAGWMRGLPRRVGQRLRKRRRCWNAIVLSELDDHMLADIGLHRDEIMSIDQDSGPRTGSRV